MSKKTIENVRGSAIDLLDGSEVDAIYSDMTRAEICENLKNYLNTNIIGRMLLKSEIRFMFAPTGPIQETSLENGWSSEFLEIAADIDQCL